MGRVETAHIIGSGVGGLAAAIRLARKGYAVTVFEAADGPGGKLGLLEQDGFRFDTGPSLFTMPHLVDDLFRLCDEDPRDHFQYEKLTTACHYFWEDGLRFQAPTDPDQYAAAASQTFGIPEKPIRKYLRSSRYFERMTRPVFLERSLHRWQSYVSWKVARAVPLLPFLGLSTSLHKLNQRRLREPHLVQLFDRYATYNGSSPYKAPGVLQVIPALEHGLGKGMGAYLPKGGMYSITKALYELALRQGVVIRFGEKVERILTEDSTAVGLVTATGEHRADLVVSNMDVVPTYRHLLPNQPAPEKTLRQERSSSAIIFYWGIGASFPELDLHNIFFSGDYKAEFDGLFDGLFDGQPMHDDPTVYLNITSKHQPSDAPKGSENWFLLINAPSNEGQDWDDLIAKTRQRTLAKLSRILGREIEPLIRTEGVLEPRTLESRTSSYQGALYGSSSNTQMAAFFRHPNFARRIEYLYFCGGSVHPGGGIPLCLHSAMIAASLAPTPKPQRT